MILADFLASRSGAPAGREAFLLAFPGEIFYNGTRQKIREVLSMASIHEHTLSNGMQLLCCPLPHLHSIEFGVYLRGGTLYENRQNQGICHLLEHLCFRCLGGMPGGELTDRKSVV